jgi:hypothetical protein
MATLFAHLRGGLAAPPVLSEAPPAVFAAIALTGQNNDARRWAPRGTRPSAPHGQRMKSAYIFGANFYLKT